MSTPKKPVILEKLKVADILDASVSAPKKGETEERLTYLVLYEGQPAEAAIWLDYYDLPKNIDPFDSTRNWTYVKKNLEEIANGGKKAINWEKSNIRFKFLKNLSQPIPCGAEGCTESFVTEKEQRYHHRKCKYYTPPPIAKSVKVEQVVIVPKDDSPQVLSEKGKKTQPSSKQSPKPATAKTTPKKSAENAKKRKVGEGTAKQLTRRVVKKRAVNSNNSAVLNSADETETLDGDASDEVVVVSDGSEACESISRDSDDAAGNAMDVDTSASELPPMRSAVKKKKQPQPVLQKPAPIKKAAAPKSKKIVEPIEVITLDPVIVPRPLPDPRHFFAHVILDETREDGEKIEIELNAQSVEGIKQEVARVLKERNNSEEHVANNFEICFFDEDFSEWVDIADITALLNDKISLKVLLAKTERS